MGLPAAHRPRMPALQDLTGRQKAAIVLMALGEEHAAPLTRGFSPDELESISYEIARMDRVPKELVNAVLQEWQETELAAQSIARGGVDYARRILESALGAPRAAEVLSRVEAQLRESTGFETLRKAEPLQIAQVLRNEHPQAIALVLSHLEPELAAAVLAGTDSETGADVLMRMARMEKVLPEVLHAVERSMGHEPALAGAQNLAAAGGPAAVAAVLNHVRGPLEKDLVDGLMAQDEEMCEQIKNLMFTFADLIRLDDRSLQRLLREVEARDLAMALKAASDELKSRIMGTMTQRAMAALKDEIDMLGPVRMRDVEAAQALVIQAVRSLEEAGEVVIGGGTDDYVE